MDLRDELYPGYARIAQAIASERRLRIIEILAQAARPVEAIARLADMTTANASQHLQLLRQAGLVVSERRGVSVWYRLAGDDVARLWLDLQSVGGERSPEVRIALQARRVAQRDGPVTREHLEELIAESKAVVIDVRPREEFEHGHVRGALGLPLAELVERLAELPRNLPVVAYCRGLACELADDAVAILRAAGIEAYRLDGGWPEWVTEGRPVEMGVQ